MSVCAFTGHRKLPGGYSAEDNKELLWRLHDAIVNHIEKYQCDTFISGMAIGVDSFSARIVLKLKEKYPHLKLIAAIPCKNHSKMWNKETQEEYQQILEKCDQVILVSDEEYKPYLMQIRNEFMSDRAQYVIAVWDGSEGGTGNMVRYCEKQDKQIYIIRP